MEALIQHLSPPREEELKETSTKEFFDGNYTLTTEVYLTYSWAKIKDRSGELIYSTQFEKPAVFWHREIGSHYLLVGRALIDLKTRTYRTFDDWILYWIHVLLSPDETTLFVAGEHYMDARVHSFYDLTGPQSTRLEGPDLQYFSSGPDDFEEDGSPSSVAYAISEFKWEPDGRFIWTEKRPWYIDMEMWSYDAERHIDSLFPMSPTVMTSSPLLNVEFIQVCDQRFQQMEDEKKEWRIYESTILKRQGNKMVVE